MVTTGMVDSWRDAFTDTKQPSISTSTTETHAGRAPVGSWARENQFPHVYCKLPSRSDSIRDNIVGVTCFICENR